MQNEIKFFRENGYLPSPKILQLEITNVCPLKCPQCYKNLHPKEIDIQGLVRILEDAKKTGIKSIMLNGGEPAVHRDFAKIIELMADTYNFNVYCFLSGFHIDEEYAKTLNRKNVYVTFSLNGSCEEVNRLSRDGYQYAIDAISLFQKLQIPCGINWVARHDNYKDFENLVRLGMKYKISWINIIRNKITHGGIQSQLLHGDYIELKRVIMQYRKEVDIRIEGCNSIMSFYCDDKLGVMYNGCQAGRMVVFMDVSGNYMPCSHLFYPESFDSIMDYWENSKVLSRIRESNKIVKCSDCKKNNQCFFCKAGSKATHDNFFEPYSECEYGLNLGKSH